MPELNKSVVLNDALIAKKIKKSLKVERFSTKRLLLILCCSVLSIVVVDFIILKVASSMAGTLPGIGAVSGLVALAAGGLIIFASIVLAFSKAYYVSGIETTAYAYIKYCKVRLANIITKQVIENQGSEPIYLITYELNGKAVRVMIEKEYFDIVSEGDDCYFLECPSAMRSNTVTRTRTFVFPRATTAYEGTPILKDIRTNLPPMR